MLNEPTMAVPLHHLLSELGSFQVFVAIQVHGARTL